MNLQELLTPNEVASYLKVPRSTVYEWCRKGKLKSIKPGLGKNIRIFKKDLESFLNDSSEFMRYGIRHNRAKNSTCNCSLKTKDASQSVPSKKET